MAAFFFGTKSNAKRAFGKTGGQSVVRSPLAWRLLILNLLAPVLLFAGLFYMDHYQQSLIDAEIKTLKVQAELMAVAVSEGAINSEFISSLLPIEQERSFRQGYFLDDTSDDEAKPFLSAFGATGSLLSRAPKEIFRLLPDLARRVLRRMASLDKVRVRLFNHNGVLTADSKVGNNLLPVQTYSEDHFFWKGLMGDTKLPPYQETPNQTAFDYPEVGVALGDGVFSSEIRYLKGYGSILSAAVPVIYDDQIVGAIMVTGGVDNVVKNLAAFRLTVFRLFTVALALTILLSFFMMKTIVTPLNRLSTAAVNVRTNGGRRQLIPDETKRKDEIGDLSGALIKMTDALWERLDATERFAADVSHEIKNPLSSLRSAVETMEHISSEDKKKRLMKIIHEDILRLDRLITDISNLSRLDAELSREVFEVIRIHNLLSSVVEVYNLGKAATERGIRFVLDWSADLSENAAVLGMETRLVQVFYNLIGNAISFSPDGSTITVRAKYRQNAIVLSFEDEGKGISPGDEAKLFQRFYCERPAEEKFGHHSGLGLSISEKIISGLSGTIFAHNRTDENGRILGACFVISLPLLPE